MIPLRMMEEHCICKNILISFSEHRNFEKTFHLQVEITDHNDFCSVEKKLTIPEKYDKLFQLMPSGTI